MYFTATGSTASRSLQDRAADVANVLDYGAGVGGDDALAIRNAIASNKQVIFIPPGTYTMKSTVGGWGHADNPTCIQVLAASNLTIIAYGATFLVDNSISGPVPTNTFSFENNCKHCALLGGTIVGNSTGLTSGQENIAICFYSVTDLTVRDVKISGNFTTAIAGVYGYDCLFENIQAFNNANSIDVAHLENVVFRGCRFQANPANPVGGLSLHYDTPTLPDNSVTTETGAARTLRGGISNNVRVLDCVFQGFGNGIAIDAIAGCLISRTIIRDGLVATSPSAQGGINLYGGTGAIAAGKTLTDVEITDCDIYGNGATSSFGCGIVLNATSTGTITNINILNNRIYDNSANGVGAVIMTGTTGIVISGNDFRSRSGGGLQTLPIHSGLVTAVTGGSGVIRNNLTVTAVGSEPPVYNNNQAVSWLDGSAATRPIFSVSPANATFIRPASAAANIQLQNYAGTALLTVGGSTNSVSYGVLPINAANDAAAASAGVPVGGTYRNGSVLQVRVA